MYAFPLQDWLTIRGASTTTASPITQSEVGWLDMSGFLDLVTFIEVREFTGSTLFCAFQTSPSKDEALFTSMNDVSVTATPLALGVQVNVLLRDTALCPLGHWLRWQIIPPASTAWDITFRIWIAANQPGGIARRRMGLGAGGDSVGGGPAWTSGVPGIGAPSSPYVPPLDTVHARQGGSLQHPAPGLDTVHARQPDGSFIPIPVDTVHAKQPSLRRPRPWWEAPPPGPNRIHATPKSQNQYIPAGVKPK